MIIDIDSGNCVLYCVVLTTSCVHVSCLCGLAVTFQCSVTSGGCTQTGGSHRSQCTWHHSLQHVIPAQEKAQEVRFQPERQPLNVQHPHVKYRDCHTHVTLQGEDSHGAAGHDVDPDHGCDA